MKVSPAHILMLPELVWMLYVKERPCPVWDMAGDELNRYVLRGQYELYRN